MTRRHFEALAHALGTTNASPGTIQAVADVCAQSNRGFDRARFERVVEEWRDRSGR